MNIINARQQARKAKISMIVESLKRIKEAGKELDEEKLILMCCSNWGLSRRIAREYIAVAKYEFEFAENVTN